MSRERSMNDHWAGFEQLEMEGKATHEKENSAGIRKVLNSRKEQNCVGAERMEH